MAKITINGVGYTSVDQVPPELRAVYERASRTGKSVSLTYTPPPAGTLPAANLQMMPAAPGGAGTPERRLSWIWVVLLAGVAAFLTYLYQRAH